MKGLQSAVLNAGLEEIGDSSFAKSGIRRVRIPAAVRAIQRGAFTACERLREVACEEGSLLEEVKGYAF